MKIPKGANEEFCDLYKNFSKKNTVPQEIDMIVGMHLSKQEKKNQKKYNNMLEVQDRLKKRIEFELNTNKTGEFGIGNKSQIIEDNNHLNNIRNYLDNDKENTNNNIPRVYDLGTTTKQVGNTIITTKTTQISYKRKRGGNNK